MSKVLYTKNRRVAEITLNRPEVFNAIDDEVPGLLSAAVAEANADNDIHVIILAGNGPAFCAGYDLTFYAEGDGSGAVSQEMPWDPLKDYAFMSQNTAHFMSLWRSAKPVICKLHGAAVAGGSDIALCCDLVIAAETASIGYMPARVWGSPTTAMWVYRLGAEQAKRMLLTGDKIDGREAARIGLILEAVPDDELDDRVTQMAHRMASVPINQLAMQKMIIKQAIEAMGLAQTQQLATVMDGIARHSPEGMAFKHRSETVGWKQAVADRDDGTYDWTKDQPITDVADIT
jgi:enoyl-CoA hydratase